MTLELELAQHLENPAWDIIKDIPGDDLSLRYKQRWQPSSYSSDRSHPARDDLAPQYTWAIPAPESIAWIVENLAGRPIVEIGAGTGYWAWMLIQSGVDVNAYDIQPPSLGWNKWHSPREDRLTEYSEEERHKHHERWKSMAKLTDDLEVINQALPEDRRSVLPKIEYEPLPHRATRSILVGKPGAEYFPVTQGGVEALELPENQTRVLFLCWPPYDSTFAYDCLNAFRGDTLIYIGEGEGGCNANDDFFELLNKEWKEIDMGPLHQWWGLHDYLTIHARTGS